MKDFLVELGYGFCFVGSQYRLILGENEYFIDLLFYHRFLKCLVAVELKTGRFRPEYAGKMDFYLDLLNDTEKPRTTTRLSALFFALNVTVWKLSFPSNQKPTQLALPNTIFVRRRPKSYANAYPMKRTGGV